MRLLGDRATADVGLSRCECSMFSVINRFRLAVSGLSLMAGSGHNTESFLVEVCLDGWISILFGSPDVPLALVLRCGSFDGSIRASEGATNSLGSDPFTAVNPWAGIAFSMEYRRPEVRSWSAGDRFSSSTIDRIGSLQSVERQERPVDLL